MRRKLRTLAVLRPARWRRRSVKLAAAATAAVILGVTVASLLWLVLPGLAPPAGPPHLALPRGLALAGAAIGLLLAIRWWTAQLGPPPLLVHIRVADEGTQRDETALARHAGLLRYAHRRRMTLRSVTRWVDLSPGPYPDPVDLVAVCAQAAAAIESILNLDAGGGSAVLSCDMPWPVALAIGAQLPLAANARLLEVTGARKREAAFSLPWKTTASLNALAVERSARPEAPPEARPDVRPEARPEARPEVPREARVGLVLAVDGAGSQVDPSEVFAGFGVGEWHLIRPMWAAGGQDDAKARRLTAAELAELAGGLPSVIASIKQRCGDRELVVVAAVPAVLALAIGWGLARDASPFFRGTHLLHLDARLGAYRAVRVHPSQQTEPAGRRLAPAALRAGRSTFRCHTLKTVYLAPCDAVSEGATVRNGDPFDAVGVAPIGAEPAEAVDERLFVSIVNLTKASVLSTGETTGRLSNGARQQSGHLRVSFAGGWKADDGDVLQAIASYRLRTERGDGYCPALSDVVVVVSDPTPAPE